MKPLKSTYCHLVVALAAMLDGGFVHAQTPAMATEAAKSTLPAPQIYSTIEANSMAYLEIIVIPLLLFILMVGVVRRQKV